jgi:predicted ATPase
VSENLVGRDGERGRLQQELGGARGGRGAVLVLRGSRGIGKTTLLDDTVDQARGFRVLRARAVES